MTRKAKTTRKKPYRRDKKRYGSTYYPTQGSTLSNALGLTQRGGKRK